MIELPGGVIEERFGIQLGEVTDPDLLDITVLGNGSTLLNGALHLVGKRITVSDLVLDGRRPTGQVLALYSSGAVTLDHVAVVNLAEPDTGGGSRKPRGASLYSIGPATTLTVRDSLFLDNKHSVDIGGFDTGMGFASARFERVRFAGSAAPEVDLGRIDRLEFLDSTRLGGTGAFAATTVRTVVLSEPTERPADESTLAACRAELERWGTAR
ncbi:MAG: hypothetical protein Q8P41_07335 [Pseudomonadota bacterium]|nr:hypothetical protein [Pseudomonadota bacterium]